MDLIIINSSPNAVTSILFLDIRYLENEDSALCSGFFPVDGSDWNITSNTTCSGGDIRLSENKTLFVADDKILELNTAVFEPSGGLDEYINLGNGSELMLDASSEAYTNDLGGDSVSTPVEYGYDANGNMLNDSQWLYTYNEDNRLVTVTDHVGGLKESYVYYHGGSRKVKVTVLNASLNKTTYYLTQSWIRDEYTNGTAENTHYIHANNELLARKDASGDVTYYHPDHLGSTTVTTNSSGELVERIMYLPYGSPRQTSEELFQFTSQEYSGELGIYDYGARQYNPQLKRFMQADSIIPDVNNPQSLNRYSYVENNPLRYIDTFGNYKVEIEVLRNSDMNNIIRLHITRVGGPSILPGLKATFRESGTLMREYEVINEADEIIGFDYDVEMDSGDTVKLSDIIKEGEEDNEKHKGGLLLCLIPPAKKLKEGSKALKYGSRVVKWGGRLKASKSYLEDDKESTQDAYEAVPFAGNVYGGVRHSWSLLTYQNLQLGQKIPEFEGTGSTFRGRDLGSKGLFHMGGYSRMSENG